MNKNSKKNSNVPNLRFPKFSGEWEETILEKECILNPKVPPLEDEFMYIDLESVTKGTLINRKKIYRSEAPSRAQRVLDKYDILFQSVRPYQLNNYIHKESGDRQWVASTGYAQIRTSCNDSYFLYQLLNSPKFNKYVLLRCTGSSYPAISNTDLGKISLSICSKEEQAKIGRFLSLLDERIATQNKIIEQYKSLIKGITHSIFKGKKANIRLKDCVKCHSSTLTEGEFAISKGDFPVYGAIGIIAYSSEYKVNKDSILIIKDGAGVGRTQYAQGKYSVIGTLNYLTAKNRCSLRYIYYLLHSFNFDKYKVGSGIPHIYFKDYGNELIYCPPIEEQYKIAQVLTLIDDKINFELRCLYNYNLQKQYLLNNLFI